MDTLFLALLWLTVLCGDMKLIGPSDTDWQCRYCGYWNFEGRERCWACDRRKG